MKRQAIGNELLAFGTLPVLWYRLAQSAAGRSFVLLVDQAIASGTNFATTLIIGRACMPEELGMYVLGFSVVVMALRIPKALIWTPYIAFTPSMTDDELRSYTGSTLLQQLLFAAGTAIAVCVLGVANLREAGGMGHMFLVLTPAVAVMLLREYVRRICFAQLRIGHAVLIDSAVAALQLSGMLALALTGNLTAARAFAVIAAASAPTLATWFALNWKSIEFRREQVSADFFKNWAFARWLLAGALVVGTIALVEPWALSMMHGKFAAGIFAAALSIVALMHPMMMGFHNFFGPQAAHVYATQGQPGLRRIVIQSTFAVALVAGTIMLGIALFSEEILSMLYGPRFAGHGGVVTALVLPTMLELVMIPTCSAIVALKRGDVLLKAHLVQLALSLTVGMWCIHQFGPQGVGYGASVSYSGAGLCSLLGLVSLIRNE